MKERLKEPRKGSEIDPETACIQTVGAPASMAFVSFEAAQSAASKVTTTKGNRRLGTRAHWRTTSARMRTYQVQSARAIQAGVTAYLLHNGSATYILWQA